MITCVTELNYNTRVFLSSHVDHKFLLIHENFDELSKDCRNLLLLLLNPVIAVGHCTVV